MLDCGGMFQSLQAASALVNNTVAEESRVSPLVSEEDLPPLTPLVGILEIISELKNLKWT